MNLMNSDYDGLTLIQALERYTSAVLWKEYEALKPFEFQVFFAGRPWTEDEKKPFRLREVRNEIHKAFIEKLAIGELIATALEYPLNARSTRIRVSAETWPHLKMDFEKGEATGQGLRLIDIHVFRNREEDTPSKNTRLPNGFDPLFRRDGRVWQVGFAGESSLFPDQTGFAYIQALLQKPGHRIDVTELTQLVDPTPVDTAMPISPRAIDAIEPEEQRRFQARLDAIQIEIEEAKEFGNLARIGGLEQERSAIAEHLRTKISRHGRPRKILDVNEKRRTRVTKAIQRALKQIAKRNPSLHAHLKTSIHTGSSCLYTPDTPTPWITD